MRNKSKEFWAYTCTRSGIYASCKYFVEKDLQSNPWGVVYRLATERFRNKGVLPSFQLEDNQHTKNIEESVSYLLYSLLPDTNNINLTPEQTAQVRDYLAIVPIDTETLEPATLEELDNIIKNISNNKASGNDLIKGKFN